MCSFTLDTRIIVVFHSQELLWENPRSCKTHKIKVQESILSACTTATMTAPTDDETTSCQYSIRLCLFHGTASAANAYEIISSFGVRLGFLPPLLLCHAVGFGVGLLSRHHHLKRVRPKSATSVLFLVRQPRFTSPGCSGRTY